MTVRARIVRALAALATVAVVGLSGAGTALAAPAPAAVTAGFIDCTDAPDVVGPADGLAGFLDPGPATPKTGDPFAANPTASIPDVYGYGPYHTVNFDLGCGPDATRDWFNTLTGTAAQFVQGGTVWCSALSATISRTLFAEDTWKFLDPMQAYTARILGGHVFIPVIALVGSLVGIGLMWQSGRARLGYVANGAAWFMLVVCVGVATTTMPVVLNSTVDKVATGSVAWINSAVSGDPTTNMADSLTANVQRAVLYNTQCAMYLGKFTGDTATTFCPKLIADQSLTRTEEQQVADGSTNLSDLIKQKQDQFKDDASDLQDADPAAYDYLAGHHNLDRLGYAGLGAFGLGVANSFSTLAALLMGLLLVGFRVLVMVLPILCLVAGTRRGAPLLVGVFDKFIGGLGLAIGSGAYTAVFVALIGGVLDPTSGGNVLTGFLFLLLADVFGWGLLAYLGWKWFHRAKLRNHAKDWLRERPTRDSGERPSGPYSGGGQQAPATASTVPAGQTVLPAAINGAITGAATTAVLGLVTGGGATVAGVAAGAAKGAATAGAGAGVSAVTGSPTAGAITATAVGAKTARLGTSTPITEAQVTVPTAEPAAITAESTQPAPTVPDDSSVWTPTSEHQQGYRPVHADDGYTIWQPTEDDAPVGGAA